MIEENNTRCFATGTRKVWCIGMPGQGQSIGEAVASAWRLSLALFLLFAAPLNAAVSWPQFRGSNGNGLAFVSNPPVRWSEHENIRWKTPVRGEGWSSPVVADGRIYLTSSLNAGRSLRAICIDAATGRLSWDTEVFRVATPEPIANNANTHASPTPVWNEARLFVSYGAHGHAALDANTGKVLWRNQELRLLHDRNGPGSSPIVYSNLYIIPCDGLRQPYIAALKTETGEIAWRSRRSKPAGKAFSTPVIAQVGDKPWLLSVASRRACAYDPLTGQEIWALDLPGNTVVPTPAIRNGVAFLCTGFPKAELWAVHLAGRGLVTEEQAVAWRYKKQVPQVSSPIVIGGNVCFVSEGGILTCIDSETGHEVLSQRLAGNFFASPVAAGGNAYFCNTEGRTFVLSAEGRPVMLATNSLAGGCHASPAISGDSLYIRTSTHLYRIGR
jgi:outer membrane protein assembly factor BamB